MASKFDERDKVIMRLLRMVKMDLVEVQTFIAAYDHNMRAAAFASLGELVAKRHQVIRNIVNTNDFMIRLDEHETKETKKALDKRRKTEVLLSTQLQKMLDKDSTPTNSDEQRYIG